MGVLNATPDSFSGDGLGTAVDALFERALSMVAEGASILDVGGESTRPGATPVSEAEELSRVRPLLKSLAGLQGAALSIDTMKAGVAEVALDLGASIVNDVSGLADPRLAATAARHGAWIVLTHNRRTARPAQDRLGGYYPADAPGDVVDEVAEGLRRLAVEAVDAGVSDTRVILDPGLGFGKSPAESLELLKRTAELRERLAPFPFLVGPSRKGFVGRALGLPVDRRLEGTLASVAIAAFAGAEIVRVHDVLPAVRVARMAWAIRLGARAPLVDG